MKSIHLNLGKRSYNILVEPGIVATLKKRIQERAQGSAVLVLTDTHIAKRYEGLLKSLSGPLFHHFVIPAGERSKQFRMAERILGFMIEKRLDRHSLLVALGGGVVGDLGGFVAATYMRGIPFVQVPTTLLSQVDSSVGGKTGVNHPLGKNLIGAFHQPSEVYIDPNFLKTLSPREFRNGYAEVVKHGIIRDEKLFATLESQHERIMRCDVALLTDIVATNCAIKASVVEQDETEKSLRAILNFGHTFGHVAESLTHYKGYSHGEAVMLGMRAAIECGRLLKRTDEKEGKRMLAYLERVGLPKPLDATSEAVYQCMLGDKKASAGKLLLVLPERIGQVALVKNPQKAVVKRAIQVMINS